MDKDLMDSLQDVNGIVSNDTDSGLAAPAANGTAVDSGFPAAPAVNEDLVDNGFSVAPPVNGAAMNSSPPVNGTAAYSSSSGFPAPPVPAAPPLNGIVTNNGNGRIPLMNYQGYNYYAAEFKAVEHVIYWIRIRNGGKLNAYTLEKLSEMVQEQMVMLVKLLAKPVDKGGRGLNWSVPKNLSAVQGALIILEKEVIRLICTEENLKKSTANGILAMYQQEGDFAGTYLEVGANQIDEWATSLVGAAEQKWKKEFHAKLRDSAERVCECSDENLVFMKNGILDYETKELIPFNPGFVTLRKSPIELPDSPPPVPVHTKPDGSQITFWEWLDSLAPYDGGKELLVKLVGAVLRNHHVWRVMVTLFNKTGRNGKSTFLRMLKACVGNENVMVSTILDLCDKNFGLANLPGCTLITCEDSNSAAYVKDTSRMKCIISHEPVSVERKHKDSFDYKPHVMAFCAANDLPRTRDKGAPWLDRNLYVPFTGQFTGKDDDKTISSEWVVSEWFCEYMVYQALIETENYYHLPEPEEALKLKREFTESNDSVVEFFNYMDEDWTLDFIPNPCAWNMYKEWMRDSRPNTNLPSQKSFNIHFAEIAVASGKWLYPKEASGKSRRFKLDAWCVRENPNFYTIPLDQHAALGMQPLVPVQFGQSYPEYCSGIVRKEMWEYCQANNGITPNDLGDRYGSVRKSLGIE